MVDSVFPEHSDTNDAANFAQYAGQDNSLDYIETGLNFDSPNYTTPEITVTGGKAYVSTGSMYADRADVTRQYTVGISIVKESETVSLTDNDVNYVWLDANIDTSDTGASRDDPNFVVNTTGSAPSNQSILLGTVDTTNDTYSEENRAPEAEFETVDVQSDFTANIKSASVSSDYTTSGEEIIFVDTTGGSVTITLSDNDTVDGKSIGIVDVGGAAGNNAITVDTQSGQLVNGESSDRVDLDYGSSEYASDGANWFTSGGSGVGAITTFRVVRGEDGVMVGQTLEAGDDMTIPSDYSMVVGERYTVDGTLTVDGNLTVVDNEDEKPPILDSYSRTANGGNSPALDTTITTDVTDTSTAFDVIVTPVSSNPGFAYEYNVSTSKGYDGSNVTVGLTVNWDDDPGAGNDLTMDIELYNRER